MHISRAPSLQCLDHRVATVFQVTALLVLAVSGIQSARAGELYGGLGFPGVMVGYAHPLSDQATVRADYATLGTRSDTTSEEGITYNTKIKANRLGLFADWFVSPGSSFRLTGGLTSNQYKLDLSGGSAGSTITIGSTTYTLTAGDRFDVKLKFPSTTPYLGLGWGHQKAPKGWGFHADVGGSIGKAKVTTTVSGALAAQVSQADIDAETAEIREGVGKIRFVPQLTVGVSYNF